MRSWIFAVLAGLLLAAPAAAQSPAPSVLSFDTTDPPGLYSAVLVQRDPNCTGMIFHEVTGTHSPPSFLFAPCRPTLRLEFEVPQSSVELFARALVGPAPELVATAHTVTGGTITVTVQDPSTWKPVVLAAPVGSGAIDYVDLRAQGADLGVDDLAISASPQPDTAVLAGPAARVEGGAATFSFGANRSDITGWRCALDGAALEPCRPPVGYTGLAEGPHSFRVTDLDRDRIPDTEELLPLGNTPPVAGVSTLATLLSGAVYVKLPSTVGLRQAGPLPGFVTLKGVAALPVGTIVDARRGRLSLQAAGDGRPVGDARRRLGRATLSQAIFRIRQAQLRRAALKARPIPTSLVLASPPSAEAGCRVRPPATGAVRTLTASIKGLFRVTGGASRAEGRNAAWRTTDRCNGTVTRVTRGLVALYDKARKRTVLLRAGRQYVARARLFQARKGSGAGVTRR